MDGWTDGWMDRWMDPTNIHTVYRYMGECQRLCGYRLVCRYMQNYIQKNTTHIDTHRQKSTYSKTKTMISHILDNAV